MGDTPLKIVVLDACRQALGAGAAHLVTRDTGQAVRTVLGAALTALAPGAVATLDFAGVGIVDFSCADECFAKLLTRLIAGEYGDKFLVLAGLGESQRENVAVALERKRLCALASGEGGGWECVGTITPHLRETLGLVTARAGLSARELAGTLGLELTAASTRLGTLHRLRLVKRRERPMGEGGREFVYEGLVPAGAPAASRVPA
jgi:hypothetical protein